MNTQVIQPQETEAAVYAPIKIQPQAIAVERSRNKKIGKVAITHASQLSCPNSCPFFNNGCYAEGGRMRVSVTSRLNAASAADPKATPYKIAMDEARAIDKLPANRHLRLHGVGDAKTNAAAQLLGAAVRRYKARAKVKGKIVYVWTYTHAWRTVLRLMWSKHISVLASCETSADIRAARERGYATSIVVPEHLSDKVYEWEGEKLLPCPEQTRGVTCDKCRLCWNDDRLREKGLTIAFAVHGNRGKAAKAAIAERNACK
jgi:hypothetical protein